MQGRVTALMAMLAALIACRPVTAASADADQCYARATALYRAGRFAAAAAELELFVDGFATDARAGETRFYLAEALMEAGEFRRAQTAFSAYLAEGDHDTRQNGRRALFRVGEAALLAEDHQSARRYLSQFRKAYPRDPLAAFALAYLADLAVRDRDYEAAQALYREVYERFPDNAAADPARISAARLAERSGALDVARGLLQQVARNGSAAQAERALVRWGLLEYDAAQYDVARRALAELLQRFPDSAYAAAAEYWQGRSYFAERQYAAAAERLAAAHEYCSDTTLSTSIAFYLAEALRVTDRFDESVVWYNRVAESDVAGAYAEHALCGLMYAAEHAAHHDEVTRLYKQFRARHADSPRVSETIRIRGRSLLQQQAYDAAADVLARLLPANNRQPEHPDPAETDQLAWDRYLLATAYLGQGRYAAALEQLAQVADISRGRLCGLAAGARAEAEIGLQNYDGAIELLRDAESHLAKSAPQPHLQAPLAIALAATGKWNSAAAAYEIVVAAIPAYPQLPALRLRLARLAEEAGETELARRWYRDLAADDHAPAEDAAEAAAALATMPTPKDGVPSADAPGAANGEHLHEVLAKHEFDPDELLAVSQSLRQRAKLSAARELLEQFCDGHPAAVTDAVLYELACLHLANGDRQAAAELFGRIVREFPHSSYWPEAALRTAQQAAMAGNAVAAEELLEQLDGIPDSPAIRQRTQCLRGQLAALHEQWDEVTATMQALLASDPEPELALSARYWIAEAEYRRADYEKAAHALSEVIAAEPDHEASWLGMVPLRQGQILAHQGQWRDALEKAETVAIRFPGFRQQFEVDYLIGRCHLAAADFDSARKAFHSVLASPDAHDRETAARAQWMLGETYMHQRDYASALREYQRVTVLHEAFPQWQAAGLLQAGKCYQLLGQSSRAAELFAQVAREYPDTPAAAEARPWWETHGRPADVGGTGK